MHVCQVGAPSQLTGVAADPETTTITVTWNQNQADVVDSYEIVYSYRVNVYHGPEPCFTSSNINVMVIDSTVSQYMLSNSTRTPIEEDSNYTISLTAINSAGRSMQASVNPRTLQAG